MLPSSEVPSVSGSTKGRDGWRRRVVMLFVAALTFAVAALTVGISPANAAPPPPPTIPVGNTPIAAIMSPDGSHVYVTNLGSSSISVIATASNTVTATITLAAGSQPQGAAVTADGSTLYVADPGHDSLLVIDTATNAVTATIALTGAMEPQVVVLTLDESKAYVTAHSSDSVSVVDTATNTLITNVPVGTQPRAVALTPDGAHLYVTNNGAGTVSVIDMATDTVTSTIPLGVGSQPTGIAILTTSAGPTAYVADVSDSISVINTATNTVTTTITLSAGTQPAQITAAPDKATIFVANQGTNTVSSIDTATNAITSTIPGNGFPTWVAVTPDGTTAYFTNLSVSSVSYLPLAVLRAASAPSGAVGTAYSFTLPSTNISSFAVTSGTLPAGLTLNAATGAISGTPTAVGSVTFAVTGTGVYTQRSRTYTLAVDSLLAASGTSVPPGVPLGAFGVVLLGLFLIRMRPRFGRRRASTIW